MRTLASYLGYLVLFSSGGLIVIVSATLAHDRWSAWRTKRQYHRRSLAERNHGRPTHPTPQHPHKGGGTRSGARVGRLEFTWDDVAHETLAPTLDDLWVKLADEGAALRRQR